MSEDFNSTINNIEDEIKENKEKIDENEQKIIELEEREYKMEDYKIFLYPAEIKKYITNLIELQSKDDESEKYYPAYTSSVENYFNDLKFNPEKIKYSINIPPNDMDYISKIISNQGWSGFHYLENLSKNINLNKPIIMYYGIIQLGAFFSNLHFNFTVQNHEVKRINNIRSHGLDSSQLKDISFNININDILSKSIKLEKTGLALRFCLAYDPSLLDHFKKQNSFSLLDLLKNYFWEKEYSIVKSQFQKDFGTTEPDIPIHSKLLNIYLLSYYLSILSRYKIHAWVRLLEDKQTNIRYFVDHFLKFGKQEFLASLFERLYDERLNIPMLKRSSSMMLL